MTCPICAWSPANSDYRLVYETSLWRIVLAPNQSLLGRCAVHLKRHAGDLAELSQAELLDWLTVVKTYEAALRAAFAATMFNWSCYMNHAYRDPNPNPHIHWWAVPRYNRPQTIAGQIFTDPHFGSPYDHYRWLEVPTDIQQQIVNNIQENIQCQTNLPTSP